MEKLQVDTLGKKVLVGVAFSYVGIVLLLPFLNVFYQVRPWPPTLTAPAGAACTCGGRVSFCVAPHGPVQQEESAAVKGCASCCAQAFRNGFGPFIEHLTDEDFLHAVRSTHSC